MCVKVDDFFFQTTFKGRVFMTHATKAIYRWLLSTLETAKEMSSIVAAVKPSEGY